MKKLLPVALVAGLVAALPAAPAAAQVNGIATHDPTGTLVRATAFRTAYEQIDAQYRTQLQQVQALNEQMQGLIQSLDTDGDGNLSAAEEQAGAATIAQIQQLEQQANQQLGPVQLAQIYVVSQVLGAYQEAIGSVIEQNNVQFLLNVEALEYAAEGADLTGTIATAIDARLPAAQIQPPAGWQPSQGAVQAYQLIQQRSAQIARIRSLQAMQQQQQGAAAPAVPAVTPAPEGR